MAIEAGMGAYGDPDTGGIYCGEECAEKDANSQGLGLANVSSITLDPKLKQYCDYEDCGALLIDEQ